MVLTPIYSYTNIHKFPEIYNGNITELENKITELENAIKDKEQEINSLKSKFKSALNSLRAEYLNMFNELENK